MKSIMYGRAARKALNALQPKVAGRVMDKIDAFAGGEHADVKRLKGEENGFRIRVGDLRVLCEVRDDTVIVLDILPRGSAYKK